jgi:pimeloyl-ACP methyl ester carboxylesterase
MADKRVKGKLSPKDESLKSQYAGHTIRLEFDGTPPGTNDPSLTFRASLTAPVNPDGAFEFVSDEHVLRDQTALLEVRSPLGTRLFSSPLVSLLEQDRIRPITVDPELPFEIAPHPDPLKGKRAVLTGRVLDLDSKRPVSNRQVLIFAIPAGAADEELEIANIPVFAARTNESGYFSGEHPSGPFAAAIADTDGVRTPLRLEADGTIPLRVVLVVSLPPTQPTTTGVSSPPRAPDEEQLLSAPELFSNDLGVGSCIDFTVPNRTLEEIPFYKVVRTTDPEIKGTNIEPPIKVLPDFDRLIKQLAFGHGTVDSKLKVRAGPEIAFGLSPTSNTLLSNREVIATRESEIANARVDEVAIRAARINDARSNVERTRASSLDRSAKPPLVAIETNGVAAVGEWREAVETRSIDVALKEALPTLSAESLRSVLVDPDEFTPVSLMTAERLSAHQLLSELVRVSRKPVAGRGPLDEQNFVDWDDTPTFYQATTIAHGHILQFRQVWKADGYSLGDLLHSIPLAPCQQKQIVTIDWDRREDAVRTEELSEREFLFANLVRDRDVKEMMDTALSEEIDGGSTAKTYGGGGGLGFAIGPLVIGASGGGSGADSTAWQDSSREVSASTMHELKDRINQSAAAVRSQRATVIQTLGQGERQRVETEVIANHNHCHALTMQYFEVLRHFQVLEELAEVRECLFVPFLMTRFHDTKVLRWREAIVRNCLKRRLLPAFDAIERIQLNYVGSDLPLGMFAEEPLESLDGDLRVNITIARPRDPKTDEPDYFEKVWPFWTRLIGGNPADVYERFLANQQFKDRVFREQLAPQIAEKFIASLRVVLYTDDGGEIEANLNPTLASKYHVGETHTVTLADSGNTPAIPRKNIVAVEIRSDYELPEHSQVVVESAAFLYSTRHLRHPLYQNSRVLDDLLFGDPVYLSTSRLSKEEERNPRAEDQQLRRKLLTHLNANLEYYHKAMWWSMDKERRFILLDGFLAPNSGGRSVASVVHNDLIGIVGNSLVFPVVAGFQLDPRYQAIKKQAEADPRKPTPDLFDLYAPITPDPPRQLSVPTKGVFAEAVMGACNCCEKIDDSRFWRWSESPCPDDPPQIAPVNVASRVGPTPDLTATDFPAPIVNFQNIPEAPDPTGLSAALQLLGRGDLFRDITGLTQNQKNALATLQASLSTAGAFGQEAIQLAHAQAAERNIDQTLNSVLEAKKDGRLTDGAAREIMKGALGNFLGKQGEKESSVVDSSAVQEAMGAAVDAKKSKVTVTEEKAGEAQTVEVSKEGPGAEGNPTSFKFEVIDDNFISVVAVQDGLVPPSLDEFKEITPAKTRSDLQKMLRELNKINNKTVLVDWFDIAEKAKFLKPDGSSGYKIKAELHFCFPNDPADPDKLLASDKPYPLVAILHGQNAGWNGDLATAKKTGTAKDIKNVERDVFTMDPLTANPQLESYKGYKYLQLELAKHGIVSVSINCNIANHLAALVRLRSEILFASLDAIRTRTDGQFKKFAGKLDFENIGLVGHSRGGDAAFDAVKRRKRKSFTYVIKALGLLAPSDSSGSVAKGKGRIDLAPKETSLFLLYGSQDPDISGAQRQKNTQDFGGTPFRHYDRSPAPKVLAFALGCSHTAFNNVWKFPEDKLKTTSALKLQGDHQNLAKEYLTAFFRRELGTATPAEQKTLRALFDGTQKNSANVPVGLQWDFGDTIVRIDDFESATNNLSTTRTPAASMTRKAFSAVKASTTDNLDLHVWQQTFALIDDVKVNTTDKLTEDLKQGGNPLNLDGFDVLTFRMTRDYDLTDQTTIDAADKVTFSVTLKNDSGGTATINQDDIYKHNVLTPNRPQVCKIVFEGKDVDVTKIFFETYQVPLSKFEIKRDKCTELMFEFGSSSVKAMKVILDDISFVKF